MNPKREMMWVQFAAAAICTLGDDKIEKGPAEIADFMLEEWEHRFGDAAFLLEGQSECAACHKPLPKGTSFTASQDAVKFCSPECLKASGRQ